MTEGKASGSDWLNEGVNARYLEEVLLEKEVKTYDEGSRSDKEVPDGLYVKNLPPSAKDMG